MGQPGFEGGPVASDHRPSPKGADAVIRFYIHTPTGYVTFRQVAAWQPTDLELVTLAIDAGCRVHVRTQGADRW
jgi:hypothetical protein